MIKKIVITGPESSGKTTLATLLAKEYNAILVNEYAREHLEKLNRPYELEDVLIMAKEQLTQEQNSSEGLTILDTDLAVYAVWLKEKYNQEVGWINEHLKTGTDKIYLLCDVNIKWEEDALREHPNTQDRKLLFDEYKNLLEKYQLTYHIISGDIPSRIKKSKEIFNQFI